MRIGPKLTVSHLSVGILPVVAVCAILLWVVGEKLEKLEYTVHEEGVEVILGQASDVLTEEARSRVEGLHQKKHNELEVLLDQMADEVEIVARSQAITTLWKDLKAYHDNGGLQDDGTILVTSGQYQQLLADSQPKLGPLIDLINYDDIYLICAKHGHVLMSNSGRSDRGQNLGEGPLRDEGLTHL